MLFFINCFVQLINQYIDFGYIHMSEIQKVLGVAGSIQKTAGISSRQGHPKAKIQRDQYTPLD